MIRKKHSKELKARIALDAIKGQKTMSELASEYGVHFTISVLDNLYRSFPLQYD